MTKDNDQCCENCAKKPLIGMIIIGASGLLTLLILVLWIRYLYNNGAPKKCT